MQTFLIPNYVRMLLVFQMIMSFENNNTYIIMSYFIAFVLVIIFNDNLFGKMTYDKLPVILLK